MQTIAIEPAVEPNDNSRTPVFSALNEYYRWIGMSPSMI
jgi:hypothetical protein